MKGFIGHCEHFEAKNLFWILIHYRIQGSFHGLDHWIRFYYVFCIYETSQDSCEITKSSFLLDWIIGGVLIMDAVELEKYWIGT